MMMSRRYKITIITSTLNCRDQLLQTGLSINSQTFRDIQWIVKDGGSHDLSESTLDGFSDINTVFIQTKDTGIYQAWNQACKYIDGEWVLFLGAGDTLNSSDSIEQLIPLLNHYGYKNRLIYGQVLVKTDCGEVYTSSKPSLLGYEYGRPKLPHHQGVLQHWTLFSEPRPFDESYLIAADSKFLLNAMCESTAIFVPLIIAQMCPGGISRRPSTVLWAQKEIDRICNELGIKRSKFYVASVWLLRYTYIFYVTTIPEKTRKRINKLYRRLGACLHRQSRA